MNNIINNTIDTYISRTNMSTSQEKWIPFSAGQCPSYIYWPATKKGFCSIRNRKKTKRQTVGYNNRR